MLLREMLSVEYTIDEAEDGREALEMLRKDHYDLLITDRDMPYINGLELLRLLREEQRVVPSLVISAFGEERLWAKAIGLGAGDYIVKPFSAKDVLRAVKKQLGEKP